MAGWTEFYIKRPWFEEVKVDILVLLVPMFPQLASFDVDSRSICGMRDLNGVEGTKRDSTDETYMEDA